MNQTASATDKVEKSIYPYVIGRLEKKDEEAMVNIIRMNLDPFEEAGSVLAASFRRIRHLYTTYSEKGCAYLAVRDSETNSLVGGAGIGPLAGLPVSEGLGEIREMVIEARYRNRGLGGNLLRECLAEARKLGYKRLYLETTKTMEPAQRLFRRFGFNPIQDRDADGTSPTLPCYFTLDFV